METPASRLLIYGTLCMVLITMAFAFFAMTGGSIRTISGHFGLGLGEVMYEPSSADSARRTTASIPVGGRSLPDLPPPPESHREPSVPETPAEEQYFAAVRKVNDLSERQARRLKSRDEVLRFLESPLGRDFRAVAELARRGRTREAREYIRKVLGGMGDLPTRIQGFGYKLAVQIYKAEKDKEGLSWALKKYLELIRDRISNSRDESDPDKDSAGSLAEIEAMMGRVEKTTGNGGR